MYYLHLMIVMVMMNVFNNLIHLCRKMFWTNWNDHQASIMTSYLSGWEVKTIITQDIKTPNGLAIDHPAHKLYWSDARLDKIERCNFDGTDRKVSYNGIDV